MTATMRPQETEKRGDTVGQRRVLPASLPDLAAHRNTHGPLPQPRDLIGLVGEAGLTGRGGAGFPTARKLAAVAAAGRTRRPVVVANGTESEPASQKDRALLAHAPHLVLDGLHLVAEALGADRAIVYLPRASGDRLAEQVAQRRAAGWDRLAVEIMVAPPGFVVGEESAVVSAIEGGPAMPRDKRRLIVEAGVRGAPTLVQNVETLAHVALIARHGPTWFREWGTPDEPGTFLVTVGGAVKTPGVYEHPLGASLGALLSAAGGPAGPLQAVLVGGYHGAWVLPDPELPVSRAALAAYGTGPGAGVVLPLPAQACGLAESARITRYLADQSAGQCGPCRNGLPHMADTLARLAQGSGGSGLVEEVRRMTALVTGRGACHHPDGTARFVRSTLLAFSAEVELHLAGRCRARGGRG
jgi:NADH:ubiquinone oxidoreductase subunit F (NADH-binding)